MMRMAATTETFTAAASLHKPFTDVWPDFVVQQLPSLTSSNTQKKGRGEGKDLSRNVLKIY